MSAVKRAVLSFSRALEFATEPELAKRMGCARSCWLRAVAKELLDNGLDAAEEAGTAPELRVTIDGDQLTVADNGPGMPPDLVERLCVRAERTSTKEAFAAPDRGSMGNAIQTLMALPFGFDRDEAVTTITSRGVEHTIALRVNRLEGCIDVERTERAVLETTGTGVTLFWPAPIDRDELVELVAEHAWLNPHAAFTVDGDYWYAKPTASVTKWTPGRATPAHWYSSERFCHRVLLEIRSNPRITVQQFLGGFKGLSDRTVRSAVAEAAGLSYAPLAALLDASGTALDHRRARALLEAMQDASRAPKHAVLGAVGRKTFEDWAAGSNPALDPESEPQFLAYTVVDGVVQDEIPYRWEVGIAHLPGATERVLLIGQNFSPAILPERMANEVLSYAGRFFGAERPIALMLHRITPARQTLDYGKSALGLSWSERSDVCAALAKVGKSWVKYATALDRGKTPKPPAGPKPQRVTIKDAVQQVLPECYAFTSSNGAYPTSPRQIYYVVRPKVLALIGAELNYNYFAPDLLPRFLQDNAELVAGWRIYFKARGTLREPHSGLIIPLGTQEVADYQRRWTNGLDLGDTDFVVPDWSPFIIGPHNRYSALIIVEKDGVADLLILAGVGERFDVAIIGNEGQSVEAELRLADALGIPIFVLHDFDRAGLTICENLRGGTWRHRYQNEFPLHEIGLRLGQVAGLESEPITKENLKSVGDARLRECGATAAEIDFLRHRRVELNALITKNLVELVETTLTEHGVEKVVPDADDLANAWRSARAHAEIAAAIEKANEKAAARWQDAPAPDDLEARVREALKRRPTMSWDAALLQIAMEDEP